MMPLMPPMAPKTVMMMPIMMQNQEAQKCHCMGPGFLMANQNIEGKQ